MRHSVVALHMEVIVWYILCDAFGKICFNNLVLIVFLIFCSFVPICTLFLLLYVEVRTDFSLENGRLELLIQSSWDSTMAGICDWMDMYALNFVGLMCKFCLKHKSFMTWSVLETEFLTTTFTTQQSNIFIRGDFWEMTLSASATLKSLVTTMYLCIN